MTCPECESEDIKPLTYIYFCLKCGKMWEKEDEDERIN